MHHTTIRLLLAFPLALLSCSASAFDCSRVIGTSGINECATGEQKKIDRKLNIVYRRLIRNLTRPDTEFEKYSELKSSVVDAQKAWLKFREADCNAIHTLYGDGSIRTAMQLECKHTHTELRIKALVEYKEEFDSKFGPVAD